MNILIVSQMFWPEHFLINELADELAQRGHQVTVYTGLPNYPQGVLYPGYSLFSGPWRQQKNGYQILRSPLIPRGKGLARLALNYFSFVFFALLGLWRLRKTSPQVSLVFATSPITVAIPAIFLRFWRGVPVVIWVLDLWPESLSAVGAFREGSGIYRAVCRLVQWIYRRCDVILVQSPAFQKRIEKWLPENSAKTFEFIPSWSVQPAQVTSCPTWVAGLPKGFRLCFAGNIGRAQAMDTLLQAAAELRTQTDIQFIIVGDGSELARMRSLAERQNLHNIVFCGRRPAEDMPALFAACDALLVTLTKQEIFALTLPGKVSAYMASAKPLLAAIDGVGAELIQQVQCGFAGPAEDAAALVQNILKLRQLPEVERLQMGQRSLHYFTAHFEKNHVIGKIEAALAQVLERKSH